MFASPDSKTDTYKFSGLFYVSIMIILLEFVKKWVTSIPKTLFTYVCSYSQVPIKQVGPNKRVEWIFWANFINEQAQINE